MIKRIFQDLDECILHTYANSMPPSEYVEFILSEDMHTYRTMIRPCAKRLFEYYNSVVGKENVYILTTATRDYAERLNQLGGFVWITITSIHAKTFSSIASVTVGMVKVQ